MSLFIAVAKLSIEPDFISSVSSFIISGTLPTTADVAAFKPRAVESCIDFPNFSISIFTAFESFCRTSNSVDSGSIFGNAAFN